MSTIIEKILISPLNCFDIPVQSHLLWQMQVYSRVWTTTLSPVQGLGMCMMAWMSLWCLADGCHHFLFSLLVQYLISSWHNRISAGRTCARHRRALVTVLSSSTSRLLLLHLVYQAWMIGERLPALLCGHQTALGRSLFREFSQLVPWLAIRLGEGKLRPVLAWSILLCPLVYLMLGVSK